MKKKIEQYLFAVEILQRADLERSVEHIQKLAGMIRGTRLMVDNSEAAMEMEIAAANLINVCRLGGRTEHAVEQLDFAHKHLTLALDAMQETSQAA